MHRTEMLSGYSVTLDLCRWLTKTGDGVTSGIEKVERLDSPG